MNKTLEIKLNLRYVGGDANTHKLDLYDASRSIKGLSQILHIVCFSLINDGEVRQRYTPLKNVDFYLEAARKGSFLETISIVLDNDAVKRIGLSVFSVAFWEMIRLTIRAGVGETDFDPKTPAVKKIIKNSPDFIDEITQALETPLVELQRPIESNNQVEITIERPRKGVVASLNSETLAYVMNDPDPEFEEEIIGNVTRFNAVTLNGGRFYSDEEGKIVSFTLGEHLTKKETVLLTDSLHRFNDDIPCKVAIDAYVIKNKKGKIKRYKIEKVEPRY